LNIRDGELYWSFGEETNTSIREVRTEKAQNTRAFSKGTAEGNLLGSPRLYYYAGPH